jgi:phage terminase large subunit GpA-like protein
MSLELADPAALLSRAVGVLLPPPALTGSQWAEQYRVLSREDSAAPGRWSNAVRPYQVEIMDVACDSITEEVTVRGCSQWGKTVILLNILGFFIHLDPGPIMVVTPTIHDSEKWSKTRFQPMVRDCAVLASLVSEQKSRNSNNTILEKRFPGGLLIVVGANAPSGLASQPIRVLLEDEIDRYRDSAGTEGDPQKLAEARTVDFRGRKKIYRCSSPTILGESNIDEDWQRSDQREWWIACPHCGFEQTLAFSQVVIPKRNWAAAVYACKGAGCVLTEPELRRAVRAGHFLAGRPHIRGHAGFDVPGVMVKPLPELAKGWLEANEGGPKELQVFINTQLGELWSRRHGEEEKVSALMARARTSAYRSNEVPLGVGLLVAGVDVQGDRVEVVVRGVGTRGTRWTILHQVIGGNPMLVELWDRLEKLINATWTNPMGHALRIRKVAIDTRFHGRQVKAWARRPSLRGRAAMVIGANRRLRSWCVPLKRVKGAFEIDTVSIKDVVYDSLAITDPEVGGYQWFPKDSREDYFDQLLSNRRNPRTQRYEPISDGQAEEVLDCTVYCEAALDLFAPRKGELEELVRFYREPAGGPLFAGLPEPDQGPAPEPPPRPAPEPPPAREQEAIMTRRPITRPLARPPRDMAEFQDWKEGLAQAQDQPLFPEAEAEEVGLSPDPAGPVLEPPRRPKHPPRRLPARSPHLPRAKKPLIGW